MYSHLFDGGLHDFANALVVHAADDFPHESEASDPKELVFRRQLFAEKRTMVRAGIGEMNGSDKGTIKR